MIKIVDVKCPDSGEPIHSSENLEALSIPTTKSNSSSPRRRDYEFARNLCPSFTNSIRAFTSYFLARFSRPERHVAGPQARQLAEWILVDGLPVRLGLQLHKFIWDPAMHGV